MELGRSGSPLASKPGAPTSRPALRTASRRDTRGQSIVPDAGDPGGSLCRGLIDWSCSLRWPVGLDCRPNRRRRTRAVPERTWHQISEARRRGRRVNGRFPRLVPYSHAFMNYRRPGDAAKKSCGQPLGESWPRANRSGTGRGGDVTGSRNSNSCLASLISARGRLSVLWRWRWPLPGDRRRARPRRWGRSATAA